MCTTKHEAHPALHYQYKFYLFKRWVPVKYTLISNPIFFSSAFLAASLKPTIAIRAPPREATGAQKHNGNEG